MASDETMLLLMYILLGNKTIRFKTDFCRDLGLLKQNLKNIEDGKNHFTPEHIERAVKKYKVNANWIFGVSNKIFIDDKYLKGNLNTSMNTSSNTKTAKNDY
ncbi:hypothetical protein [uncultured Christiangramia sp.]|uniref:hypothetical protein n=1 Tax=uncultured Christiangramia sp. TaxID=503836 RepID=UPI00260BBAEF|nr:hypothetical protein [uncultured Christiangramia sp.]